MCRVSDRHLARRTFFPRQSKPQDPIGIQNASPGHDSILSKGYLIELPQDKALEESKKSQKNRNSLTRKNFFPGRFSKIQLQRISHSHSRRISPDRHPVPPPLKGTPRGAISFFDFAGNNQPEGFAAADEKWQEKNEKKSPGHKSFKESARLTQQPHEGATHESTEEFKSSGRRIDVARTRQASIQEISHKEKMRKRYAREIRCKQFD